MILSGRKLLEMKLAFSQSEKAEEGANAPSSFSPAPPFFKNFYYNFTFIQSKYNSHLQGGL